MITLDNECDEPLKRTFKQLKLITSKEDRKWNGKRVIEQLYFIAAYHQFRKIDLSKFCKANGLGVVGKKEVLVKRIWEGGFDFEDVLKFVSQNTRQIPEGTKIMYLTERIQIKATSELQRLFRLSRELYNKANMLVHAGFHQVVLWNVPTVQKAGQWLRYLELYRELKNNPEFKALPSKTSQQILLQVKHAWSSFFKALKEWKKDLELPNHERKFRGRPQPPGVKDDENLLFFNYEQCSIKKNKTTGKFYLHLSPRATNIPPIQISKDRIDGKLHQVRILPKDYHCILEIVYKKEIIPKNEIEEFRIVAIDLGVRNLVCLVNNIPGVRPVIVRGGVAKSINQYYNRQRSHYQKVYAGLGIQETTRRLARLTRRRNNKIEDIFHKLSRAIIEYCKFHRIGTIVIGYNARWKQNSSIGKRNNQNFVNIPFYHLIQKIQYKAELVGIKVLLIEESHTSKCSFLDNEPIEHHETYRGKRGVYRSEKEGGNGKVSHGLFKAAAGRIINADVNGAYNILRKAFPKFSYDGIEGLELVPVAVKFSKADQDFTQIKQLANLITPTQALPKAAKVDGREIGGLSISRDSAINK